MILQAVLFASLLSAGCQPVETDKILVGDLAGVLPMFAGADATRVLGYAPLVGTQRHFTVSELKSLASTLGVPGEPTGEVCFTRATAVLKAEQIVAAMRKALQDEQIEIHVLDFSRAALPLGEPVFPAEGLTVPQKPDQATFWRGTIAYGASRRLSIWAKVILQAPCSRVSAAQTLPAGVPLALDAVRVENTTGHPKHPYCTSLDEVLQKAPRRTIAPGTVLSAALLESPLAIKRGESVSVVSEQSGIRLRIDGIAESAGRTGDHIVVRNPSSGRKLTARVEGPGKAFLERASGAIR